MAELILSNSPQSFQNSSVCENFPKLKPNVANYRDYRKFPNDKFRLELDNEILKHNINNMEYPNFLNIFI